MNIISLYDLYSIKKIDKPKKKIMDYIFFVD